VIVIIISINYVSTHSFICPNCHQLYSLHPFLLFRNYFPFLLTIQRSRVETCLKQERLFICIWVLHLITRHVFRRSAIFVHERSIFIGLENCFNWHGLTHACCYPDGFSVRFLLYQKTQSNSSSFPNSVLTNLHFHICFSLHHPL